jgi:hypothetical protein
MASSTPFSLVIGFVLRWPSLARGGGAANRAARGCLRRTAWKKYVGDERSLEGRQAIPPKAPPSSEVTRTSQNIGTWNSKLLQFCTDSAVVAYSTTVAEAMQVTSNSPPLTIRSASPSYSKRQ